MEHTALPLTWSPAPRVSLAVAEPVHIRTPPSHSSVEKQPPYCMERQRGRLLASLQAPCQMYLFLFSIVRVLYHCVSFCCWPEICVLSGERRRKAMTAEGLVLLPLGCSSLALLS